MAKTADIDLSVTGTLEEFAELVPAKVRTAAYATAVGIALLTPAAQWVAGIWWPELDTRVDRTASGVLTAALLVVSVLGTAYRPTRGALLPVAEAVPLPPLVTRTCACGATTSWPTDTTAEIRCSCGRALQAAPEDVSPAG